MERPRLSNVPARRTWGWNLSFRVAVGVLVALFVSAAHAETQWTNSLIPGPWPSATAACVNGEVEPRIQALRSANPSIQYRYRTLVVNEYLPGEESQCNYVIERRLGTIWTIQETGPRNHFGTGTADPCPEGIIDDSGYCQPKNAGPPLCPKTGNPIDSATGNKYQHEVDYAGGGHYPLVFERHYNSLSREAGVLGRNWRHHYQRSLVVTALSGDTMSRVKVYRHDGRRYEFNLSGGVFTPDADVSFRLQRAVVNNTTSNWRLTTPDDEVELYDPQGLLLSITSRSGQRHTLAYDASRRLASVTDTDGRQLTFTYDAGNRMAAVTIPGGQSVTFGYDAGNRLQTANYPGTTTRTYVYNESSLTSNTDLPWALTGIIDEGATRYASFGYDAQGRSVSSEHAGGAERVTVSYLANGVRTVTDAANAARTFTYSTILGTRRNTGVSQSCSACGGTAQSLQYDANGNVSSRTDYNENVTTYAYDLARNLETSRTEADGSAMERTITTAWHATFRLPAQIDEPGRRTTFTYDAGGNVLTRTLSDLTVTPNVVRTWTYSYDAVGRMLTENGPRTDINDITTYTYYACTTGGQCGQVQTITNALNQVTTFNSYNAHGQPLTVTDPNGVVTTMTYDGRQRLIARAVGGETTSFTYYPNGLLRRVTLPDASFTENTYDAAQRLIQVADAEGNRIVYTLNAMGQRTREDVYDPSNALARTRSWTYDALSRMAQEIGAAGTAAVTTTFGYDDNGNQTSASAPLARNSANAYDALNRLSQVTDAANGVTQYAYDALDQLLSVTDPRGLVTSYEYNAFGDVIEQTSPDTGVTSTTYDSAGNLATRTDARGVGVGRALYSYDALNRLLQVQYPDHSVSYSYDSCPNGVGRLCGMTDASGSTGYEYDAQGRITRKTQLVSLGGQWSPHARTLRYLYTNGRLTGLQMPDGQTVNYAYDSAGRVASMSMTWTSGTTTTLPLLSDVLYEPFGDVRGWTWANGTLEIREHDLDGRITDIESAGGAQYAYDAADRITGITSLSGNPAPSWVYGYDLLDRLTSATRPGFDQSFTYDANGNRLTQGGTQSGSYAYADPFASNRLQSIAGAPNRSYAYDAMGNIVSDGLRTFGYDGAGRMVSAGISSFRYNGLGQRTRKESFTNQIATYMYDESGRAIEKCDVWWTPGMCDPHYTQQYVWLEGRPVVALLPHVEFDDEGYIVQAYVALFDVHTDHLSSPRRLTRLGGAAGQVAWQWQPDAFGVGAAEGNVEGAANRVPYALDLRFPGQMWDWETGLHYNYFRDYDPATGRYVQSDPIGLAGGINTYSYVGSNPISFSDPLGLLPICETIQVGSTRRSWTEVSHKGIKIPGINMYPTGPGIGPNPSLLPPRRPPIGTQVRWEVWFVWLHFRRDINTTYEQFIQHMENFCKDKITDECGREKEITLEPSFFDITHDPIKRSVTETDIYLFTELVKRLGTT